MFAAYASNDPSQSSSSSADVETDSSRNWLENSSFISTAIPSKAVGKVTSDSKRNKKKKRQKKKEQEKEKTKNLDNYSYLSFSNSTSKNDIAFKNTIHNHGFQSINEMFYEDHKPIRSNLAFPHMHFKDVALHSHLKGYLGAGSNTKFLIKRSKPLRYFHKKSSKTLKRVPEEKQMEEGRTLASIYDSSTLSYVQGNCSKQTTSEDLFLRASNISSLPLAHMNQKLRENPHDIDLWLMFVELQTSNFSAVTNEENGSHEITIPNSNRSMKNKALLERKVSILEKAIQLNPKNVDLGIARMKLLAEFWETSALHQEWRNILFVNPMSTELWKEYLTTLEGSFEGFTVAQVLKAYSSCFQKLIQMQNPSFAAHQRPENLDELMIDIASRLSLFLRQTGWTEKSISYIQALIELGLQMKPDDLTSPLDWLKARWESNVPRIGESASTDLREGDKKTPYGIRSVHGTNTLKDEDEILCTSQPFYHKWKEIEKTRSNEHWQSCSHQNECEDDERYVSFSDISQYLFVCQKKGHLQYRLMVGCLASIGVPLTPASQAQLFWSPNPMNDHLIYCLGNVPAVAFLQSSSPDFVTNEPYLAFIRRLVLQSYKLLEKPFNLDIALWWLEVEKIRIKTLKNSSSHITKFWKETKAWVKNFLKIIPTSDISSTIMLYHSYAMIEQEVDSNHHSQETLLTLLKMYPFNPFSQKETQPREKNVYLRLWLSYSRSVLSSNTQQSHERVLTHLVKLGLGSDFSTDSNNPSPAMILKAKRKYDMIFQEICKETAANQMFPEKPIFHHPDEIVDFLGCYSLFLSLTDGCRTACEVLKTWFRESEADYDIRFTPLNRFNSRFLKYHSRRESVYILVLETLTACRDWVKDYQPRLFYDTMCIALKEYPDSMQLLAILIKSEERCNMFSPLWNSLMNKAKSGRDLTNTRSALAACLALASREESIKKGEEKTLSGSAGVPTLHLSYRRKMDHLLEHCVSQYPGRHDTVLWRLFMHSLYLSGSPAKCKPLFYRAVRDCPKSKDIYLDIIEYAPDSLKEVTELLEEKNLRLRLPLEELRLLLEEECDESSDKID